MNQDELREKLTAYKVALQPNKQPDIWKTLCHTIENRKKIQSIVRLIFIHLCGCGVEGSL